MGRTSIVIEEAAYKGGATHYPEDARGGEFWSVKLTAGADWRTDTTVTIRAHKRADVLALREALADMVDQIDAVAADAQAADEQAQLAAEGGE